MDWSAFDEIGVTDINTFNEYKNLVEKNLNTTKDVFEVHHIIPKCLGGSDKKENLVALQPYDHLLAHMLLSDSIDHAGLHFAFWGMCNQKSRDRFYDVEPEIYNKARIRAKETNRDRAIERLSKLSLSDKQKLTQNAREALKYKFDNMTEDELKNWGEISRLNVSRYRSNLSEEERAKYNRKISEGKKAEYANKTEDQIIAFKERQSRDSWNRNKELWLKAQEIYDVWVCTAEPRLANLSKKLDINKSKIHRMVNRFKYGWIPEECDNWNHWVDSILK